MSISIIEIDSWPSSMAEQARSLYERSFPPAELQDFDRITEAIGKQVEPRLLHALIAMKDERLLGMSFFKRLPEASLGYLWYLCIDEASRGTGIGSQLYCRSSDILVDEARKQGEQTKGMIFEVERLDSEPHPVYGDPVRRVKFYHRLGAKLILGYDYWQPPIPPHGPVPLQLMFHPIDLEDPTQDELARIVSGFLRYGQGIENAQVDSSCLRLGMIE